MDIFFGSSPSVFWRQKSTVKGARCLVIIFLCIWTLLDLPYFFLQDLILNVQTGKYTCVTTDGTYALFRNYFIVVGLYLVIPVMTISVFGFLTYRQLQKLNVQQRRSLSALTKQITQMVLFEITIVLIFVTPYALATIYFVVTANMIKSVYRLAQESVIQVVFNIYGYGALSVRKLVFMHKHCRVDVVSLCRVRFTATV
jgi:hypothetical protein